MQLIFVNKSVNVKFKYLHWCLWCVNIFIDVCDVCALFRFFSSSMISIIVVARTKNADWTWKKRSQRLNGHGGTFIVEPHTHTLIPDELSNVCLFVNCPHWGRFLTNMLHLYYRLCTNLFVTLDKQRYLSSLNKDIFYVNKTM